MTILALHRAGVWTAEALFVAAALALLPACADAEAVTASRAGQLDQVRLGFALDTEGRVCSGCTASKFALRDPIHLSVQVRGAIPGAVVRASVRDSVTQRVAWTESRPVPAGESYVTFEIGRALPEGRYRSELTLGGAATIPREFVVHVWHGEAH
jgi:hypothetical protein